jgi:uncharacterized cofD-like protein
MTRSLRDLRWLAPGLMVKRWMLLVLIGTTLLGLGFAVLILDVYRNTPETWWLPIMAALSLRFLTRPLRALIFGGIGLGLIWYGSVKLNRSLLKPFLRPGKPILDTVTTYRKKERGPRVVAIGGGTGLSTLLRGLKQHTSNITAIVTVADDGGSSGELRRSLGVLPPGDIRNCLAALSDDEEMLTQIFQYRFSEGAGLSGHTLGNLLITALTDISGSFEGGVTEAGRVLAVRGQVMPSTLHDVRLGADLVLPDNTHEVRVKGESRITEMNGKIQRVWLEPNNPLAYPPAIQAILNAELIVVGPGSLYTSLLPNLLVPDIAEALRISRAVKVFVVNVASQPGETDNYTSLDHIRTIEKHLGKGLFDLILINNRYDRPLPGKLTWVTPGEDFNEHYPAYAADLIDLDRPWRHDSNKLASVIIDLFYERTGPLMVREEENH